MVTKKEEREISKEIEDVTKQLQKMAGGEAVSGDILETALRTNLKENKNNVLVAFLDGDEVSVIHLKADNLNNADFIKRLMGG